MDVSHNNNYKLMIVSCRINGCLRWLEEVSYPISTLLWDMFCDLTRFPFNFHCTGSNEDLPLALVNLNRKTLAIKRNHVNLKLCC